MDYLEKLTNVKKNDLKSIFFKQFIIDLGVILFVLLCMTLNIVAFNDNYSLPNDTKFLLFTSISMLTIFYSFNGAFLGFNLIFRDKERREFIGSKYLNNLIFCFIFIVFISIISVCFSVLFMNNIMFALSYFLIYSASLLFHLDRSFVAFFKNKQQVIS